MAASLLCALLCAAPETTGQSIRLRVMSMNIKEGASYAGHESGPYAELINGKAPDVVCLQEVDWMTVRNGGRDFLNELASKTGMFPYWCMSFSYQGGGFGVALLSRYPFIKAEKITTVLDGAKEPRSTGWIYVMLPGGGTVRVASTHLALETPQITTRNIADINSRMFENDSLTPTLLIGDFNAAEGSDPIAYAKTRWQEIGAGTGFTIPSDKPNRKLDYVMGYPKKWNASSYEIIARPDLSDHCFIVADVVYGEE